MAAPPVLAAWLVSLHTLPEPCDEVAVGGTRRRPEPGHREACRLGHHPGMALITGVIEHEGNRPFYGLATVAQRNDALPIDT